MSNTSVAMPALDSEAEPFFPYVQNRDTGYSPELQLLLDGIKSRMGFVPNSIGLYLNRPEIAEAILRFNAAVHIDPSSTLPLLLKRKLALVCSSINGCAYCTAHQCSYLSKPRGPGTESWTFTSKGLEEIVDGTQPTDEFEQVCFDYARAASSDPSGVTDELRREMRRLLTSAQIMELAFVVGHWKLLNTMHDSLRVPIEETNLQYMGYVERVKDIDRSAA